MQVNLMRVKRDSQRSQKLVKGVGGEVERIHDMES